MQQIALEMTVSGPNISPTTPSEEETQLRDLFLFTAGERIFALPAEEVEGTAEAKHPAPLPHAPAPILGIVHVRGRMLTVIDPLSLTTDEAPVRPPGIPHVISLRGDEQLALAADSVRETITISPADIEDAPENPDSEANQALCGILRHGGETITVIDPARLFEAAVRRKERRRRRF
jgi:purine-binding chemotaxis protein CheW